MRSVLRFLVFAGTLPLLIGHGNGGEPLLPWNQDDGDDEPVECPEPATTHWQSEAECLPGVIRIERKDCAAHVELPNGERLETSQYDASELSLFSEAEGDCHLDFEQGLIECDYGCDDRQGDSPCAPAGMGSGWALPDSTDSDPGKS